jgi:membrane-associated protein
MSVFSLRSISELFNSRGKFLSLGYLFGNLPFLIDNFRFVILGIIFVSLLPGVITYIQSKRDPKSV